MFLEIDVAIDESQQKCVIFSSLLRAFLESSFQSKKAPSPKMERRLALP
jgi:hypothetical protein